LTSAPPFDWQIIMQSIDIVAGALTIIRGRRAAASEHHLPPVWTPLQGGLRLAAADVATPRPRAVGRAPAVPAAPVRSTSATRARR